VSNYIGSGKSSGCAANSPPSTFPAQTPVILGEPSGRAEADRREESHYLRGLRVKPAMPCPAEFAIRQVGA